MLRCVIFRMPASSALVSKATAGTVVRLLLVGVDVSACFGMTFGVNAQPKPTSTDNAALYGPRLTGGAI